MAHLCFTICDSAPTLGLVNAFSAGSEQNIAVDKRYQTKVKVMVRNITPKARNSST
jgi:hypothetical protein